MRHRFIRSLVMIAFLAAPTYPQTAAAATPQGSIQSIHPEWTLDESGSLRVLNVFSDSTALVAGEWGRIVASGKMDLSGLEIPRRDRLSGRGFLQVADFIPNGIPPEGDAPMDLAFTPDGAKIVVAHRDSRNVTVFDAATRAVLQSIALSGSPNALAVSPNGVQVVTANIFENSASIVDLTEGTETAVIPLGSQPAVVRITPDGGTAVLVNTNEQSLSVVDIAAAEEVRRIQTGARPSGSFSFGSESAYAVVRYEPFEITPDSRTVIITDFDRDRLLFVDIATGTISSIYVANPYAIDMTPDGATVVVAQPATAVVSVIDVPSKAVKKVVTVYAEVSFWGGIAVNHTGTKAVVPLLNSAVLVNLVADSVSTLETGCCLDLTTTADGRYCFAGGFYGSLIDFQTGAIVANLNNVTRGFAAAVSPGGPRAALITNLHRETLLVFNTDGWDGFMEGTVPSGPPPEGDQAVRVAVSPDGATAVFVNRISENATIVDVDSQRVDAVVSTGIRPNDVKITPDGSKALVTNLDSPYLTVIDLETHAVSSVNIPTRAGEIQIAPDGQYAYVSIIAYVDGVWRIDLNSMAVAGSPISTGNLGGVGFTKTSGFVLSHDGRTLVTCNTYTNDLSIIDTGQWREVARLRMDDFPTRAAFSPDDSTIYVSNGRSRTIAIVKNAGGNSARVGTIFMTNIPFELELAPDSSALFIGTSDDEGEAAIEVVPLPGQIVSQSIPVTGGGVWDMHLDASNFNLFAAVGFWQWSWGPYDLVATRAAGGLLVVDAKRRAARDWIDTGIPSIALASCEGCPLMLLISPYTDGLSLVDVSGYTPVLISQFFGRVVEAGVQLEWTTSSEVYHDGFNVYRAENGTNIRVKLNEDLIRGTSPYRFIDRGARPGEDYLYFLGAVDLSGDEVVYGPVQVRVPDGAARGISLFQNYPNPFNPATTIPFSVPERTHVTLSVFEPGGRLVVTLIDRTVDGGTTRVVWDGRDANGETVTSGLYFCRLSTRGGTAVRKLVLLR